MKDVENFQANFEILSRQVTDKQDDVARFKDCLLYTSDAADERSSVDLGGCRIIKKKTNNTVWQKNVVESSKQKTTSMRKCNKDVKMR